MKYSFRKEVAAMCNLTQGIVEDAVNDTTEKILSMNEDGIKVEQIARITKETVEEVEEIIKKNEPVMV